MNFSHGYLEAISPGTIILTRKLQSLQKLSLGHLGLGLGIFLKAFTSTNDILNSLSGGDVIFNAGPQNIMALCMCVCVLSVPLKANI